jgi:hypothetical protein
MYFHDLKAALIKMGYNFGYIGYNFTYAKYNFISEGEIVAKFVAEVAEIVIGKYRRKIGPGTYNFSYNTYKKIVVIPTLFS